MARNSFILAVVVLIDITATTGYTLVPFWPLRDGVVSSLTALGWSGIACNSNVDLWALAVLRFFVVVSIWTWGMHSGVKRSACWSTNSELVVQIMSLCFQFLLLAKMAVVASCGTDNIWPSIPSQRAGLVLIFGSAALSFMFVCLQAHYLRRASKSARWRKQGCGGIEEGINQPLLGGKEKDEAESLSTWELVVELGRLARPDAFVMSIALTSGLSASILNVMIPYCAGRGIDYAAIEPDHSKFVLWMMWLILSVIGCSLLVMARGGLFSLITFRVQVRIRHELFQSLLQQEIAFFDKVGSGALSSRLQTDVTSVSNSMSQYINIIARSLMQLVVVTIFMAKSNWRLTVIILMIIPPARIVTQLYDHHNKKLQQYVLTSLANVNSAAVEALSAITTVRAHAAEDSCEATYVRGLAECYKLQSKQAALYSGYIGFVTLAPNAALVWVLFLGGHLVLTGKLTPGALVAFILYQQNFANACQFLGNSVSMFSEAVGSLAKISQLIHRKPQIIPTRGLTVQHFEGNVELKDVVYYYPSRPECTVLGGLSLRVNSGEVVALVGPSGGGKSTIMKLLQRFYTPVAGCVLFDGRDVSEYDEHFLRKKVAVVDQQPTLFDQTIKQNIVLGMEDGVNPVPTQEQIEEVCRMANAHTFIQSLPLGYETMCGESGVQLSGGQKQRIAIARALVRNPRVLLLDEATSALDAESEALVQEAIQRCSVDRTVIVIAHRLSTIQGADRIAVIKDGRLIETGRHKELLETGGMYSSLVRKQMVVVGGCNGRKGEELQLH